MVSNNCIYIKGKLDDLLSKKAFSGYAFSLIEQDSTNIVVNGKTSHSKGATNVKGDTLFDLASLTKVVATVTTCLKLIEEGMLNIYEDVDRYLPDYPHKSVKVINLLNHTSGHAPGIKSYSDLTMDTDIRERVKESLYKENDFQYSDINYIYLSDIIEKVTGDFDKYFKEKILLPLRMNKTTFNPKSFGYKDFCASEVCRFRGLVNGDVHDELAYLLGGISGNAGLFSNIEDLTIFAKMLIDGGNYYDKNILSGKSMDLLKRITTPENVRSRSLGWLIDKNKIYHTGFTGTSCIVDFNEQKGLIILTNRVHPSRYNIDLLEVRNEIHRKLFRYNNF